VDADRPKGRKPAVEKTMPLEGGEALEGAAHDEGAKMTAAPSLRVPAVAGALVGNRDPPVGKHTQDLLVQSDGGGERRARHVRQSVRR
jgi:hypothetical protein